MKCKNGKYKYGKRGRCQYDTLEQCKKAAAAIHAQGGKSTKDCGKSEVEKLDCGCKK